jgi:aminoglycoside phosphotransferase (APT) family kinase protein
VPFEPFPIYELDTEDRARRWVSSRLGVEPQVLRPLSGGVSNTVLLAEAGGQRLVIKQSLPRLRVEAEWFCDRNRILRECDALKLLAPVLPPGAVPRVVLEDPDNCAFAMTAAPEAAETWKAHLLRGEIDTGIARQLGEFLGALIASTAEVDSRFSDMSVFDTLRLDAYYRYTAARYPDLSDRLYRLITDCETQRISLVHGDFSPKNILVDSGAAIVIDWECVHYGNPAFDAAFLLNHLLLKSFHMPGRAGELAGVY